jgi:PAS domain S-box-containing protein
MLDPTGRLDDRFIARAQKFSFAAGMLILLVGIIVLSGWSLNLPQLKGVFGSVAVKANTALSLIFAGLSLCLVNLDQKQRALRIASQICATVVGLIGLLTLAEHLTGMNFGIDQLLFTEAPGAPMTTSPGRMGPPASTCFMLAGAALLFLENRKLVRLRQSLSIFICVWALLAIVGYVYQAELLYRVARFTGIALPTAISLFILGIGLLTARINEGVTRILSERDAGGLMARRLLLMVVAVPFLLGWAIVMGQRLGYYDLGFGTAVLVLFIIIIFAFAVWQGSVSLNYAEQLRAAAQRELHQKDEGLRLQASLINLSYEPILVWGVDTKIIEWNQGCEQLYGYDRAAALEQKSHELLQTQFPISLDEFERALKRDRQWSGILRHVARDGREVWVESRQQLFESNGRELVLETNRDITKQIEAEESGLRLAAIVASSNDAIIGKTLGGIITSWNEGATRIFGYTAEEVLGQSVSILIPEDRPDEEPAIIERLKRGEQVDHYQTIRVRKDGQLIDISLTISPIRNSLGKIIGASKVARDITETKRSEQRLRESERLQRLLAQIGEQAARAGELNELMKFVTAQVAIEMGISRCGYSSVDLRTGVISVEHEYSVEFAPLAGDFSVAEFAQHLKDDAIAGRITNSPDLASEPQTSLAYEERFKSISIRAYLNVPIHRAGSWVANFWVSHHEPHEWSRAEIELMRIIADRIGLVMERKNAESERERLLAREQAARAEAETANRVKDEFLATVSHELRTPLNAILGWSSMLVAGKLSETDAVHALEAIVRNARSQAQIIEDILDVSRTVSGKLRLDLKPIELISVIRAAVDVVSPAAEAKGVQLLLSLEPSADRVQGDAARMQQVIWNLLTNAVKFTPENGRIEVKLKRVDSFAEIAVCDTGEGITKEFLPYVFDRFHQADGSTTRRHGGLGLGLAIARHLVEMHGGTIAAYSDGLGRGASFILKVPIAAARSEVTAPLEMKQPPDQTPRNEEPHLRGLRVLAIDDEADVREMLKTLFEEYGADILTVSSAREGLESMAGWKPHVLISDIGMPDEDGYAFIRKVRSLPSDQGADTPAIALTGYVRVEERMRALEAGFQMFVAKPVETNELISLIGDLCPDADRDS